MTTFSHAGRSGDLVYALPTVAAMGGGDLVLCPPDPATPCQPWSEATAAAIQPLLEAQPYIGKVRRGEPEGMVMDVWRRHRPAAPVANISDLVSDAFGVPYWHPCLPWLEVVRRPVAEVVLHRSPRYHGVGFPWRDIVRLYGRRAAFVGSPEEHRAFTAEFGHVPRHHTPNCLALAEVIAGAALFVGNQSLPRAIAEGLKRPVWQETCPHPDNSRWARPGAWYTHAGPARREVTRECVPAVPL